MEGKRIRRKSYTTSRGSGGVERSPNIPAAERTTEAFNPAVLFKRLFYNSRWGATPNKVRAKLVLVVEDVENGKGVRVPNWSIPLTFGDYETVKDLKKLILKTLEEWSEEGQ